MSDNLIREKVGGFFSIDNNNAGTGPHEINGWGPAGPIDDNNTQDLGDTTAYPNLARLSGGIHFDIDVRLVRFSAWHRVNNANALRFAFLITALLKEDGTNNQTEREMYSEIGSYRDYTDNNNRWLSIDTFTDALLPAGEVLNLAVATDPSETTDTNRRVEIQSGLLVFEPLIKETTFL